MKKIAGVLQCLYCGQGFQLDDQAAKEHWKKCPYSSMRKEFEAMQTLLRKIRTRMVGICPEYWAESIIDEIDNLLAEAAENE